MPVIPGYSELDAVALSMVRMRSRSILMKGSTFSDTDIYS